jgi:hypothetical protein
METNVRDRKYGSEGACIEHMFLSWLQVRHLREKLIIVFMFHLEWETETASIRFWFEKTGIVNRIQNISQEE